MQREITLLDIIILLLQKVKLICIFILVFAFLCGGIGVITGLHHHYNKDFQEKEMAAYQENLDLYTKEIIELENELLEMKNVREDLIKYKENSIYYNIDSYHEAVKEIIFYIETNYQIMPGMDYQNPDKTTKIIGAYIGTYKNSELYTLLSQVIGKSIESQYLNELISVEQVSDGILKVKARYSNDIMAAKLADQTFSFMRNKVSETLGEHQISILSEATFIETDMELKDIQTKKAKELKQLNNSIPEKENILETKKNSAPEQPNFSKSSIIKKGLLFAIVGSILGAMISCLCLLIIYMTDNHFKTVGDFEKRYSYPVITTVRSEKSAKKLLFQNVIQHLDSDDDLELFFDNAMQLAAVSINAVSDQHSANIIVTGTVDFNAISKISERLNTFTENQFSPNACALVCHTTWDLLKQADGVILVEKRGTSKMISVDRQIQRIEQIGKTIIGFIIL